MKHAHISLCDMKLIFLHNILYNLHKD